jgi:NCAIR mutase (PurE)-related protein
MMERQALTALLERVARGELSPEQAVEEAALAPLRASLSPLEDDAVDLRLDHGRGLRCGSPEVVYAEGKTVDQVVRAATALAAEAPRLLVTRADEDQAAALCAALPEAIHEPAARTVAWRDAAHPASPAEGRVLILAAGTSDLPVAEEARVTTTWLGAKAELLADVGVAGLHRILSQVERIRTADALVVVAGMEGALPSVVAGLSPKPLIAVPTSVGYGASYGGLAALLAMMNGCAPGVGVVNIDNGFGAAVLAVRIAHAACGLHVSPP